MNSIIFINSDLTKPMPGLESINSFSCSAQLSIVFFMLINVKMPTIVGISTFISMINTISESLKARKQEKIFIIHQSTIYERLNFMII